MCAVELLAVVYGSHRADLPILAGGFFPKPLQPSDPDRTISNRRYPFAGNLSKETLDFSRILPTNPNQISILDFMYFNSNIVRVIYESAINSL